MPPIPEAPSRVALRKESVDRNVHGRKRGNASSRSLSARRAWIEIVAVHEQHGQRPSLSARRAWIEIPAKRKRWNGRSASLSARRAWIEIAEKRLLRSAPAVALRKESVDRNPKRFYSKRNIVGVALRKESVDRNTEEDTHTTQTYVALRKESVDRNPFRLSTQKKEHSSLSARRAWIEIDCGRNTMPYFGSRSPQGERG